MPDLPLPSDPVVAILLDRLDRLSKDLSDHRRESKEDRKGTEARLHSLESKTEERMNSLEFKLNQKLEPVTAAFNRAAGGYLAIVGLAGIIAWASGLWEHLTKVFH